MNAKREPYCRAARQRERRCLIQLTLSVFVQLYVPVQVVPPAQRRVPDPDGKGDHGHPPRLERRSDQSHARFTRGPAAFFVIARQTGGYAIVPRGLASLNDT